MWQHQNNQLHKSFLFDNFIDAFAFMTKVAFTAERLNHHPLWTNVYNKVDIWLATHDAGNIVTEKDIELAKEIDALLK